VNLTYYGNAMIKLEGRDTKILCDPWVTFDRTSDSGLYTFPELKMTREEVRAINPDFIYISHTHEDHFDPETLGLFDRAVPILVANYAHNFTEANVRGLGFRDVRVVEWEDGLALNGEDYCWLQPNAVYSEVDSMMVVRLDGETVINLNDNPFDETQCQAIRERFGSIKLACVPFAYQGPYPAFYENLDDDTRLAEAVAKRDRNYEVMTRFAETLAPERIFPFAAGALYGGWRALRHPYYGVGTAEGAIAHAGGRLKAKPVLLSQFGMYDLTEDARIGEYQPRSYEDEADYVVHISRIPGPFAEGGRFWVDDNDRIDLTKLFQKARVRQKGWQGRRGFASDAVYFIDVGQPQLYRFCLSDDTVTRCAEDEIADPKFEIFRVPYPLIVGILTGHYNWSNVKTQHIGFYREPNVFDANLHILMSYLQV
jgi:hypothetical protein